MSAEIAGAEENPAEGVFRARLCPEERIVRKESEGVRRRQMLRGGFGEDLDEVSHPRWFRANVWGYQFDFAFDDVPNVIVIPLDDDEDGIEAPVG